jgi:hypothetical protein
MPDKKYSGLISLRIDPKLHQQIAELAIKKNRSINQLISLVMEEVVAKNNAPQVTNDSFENRQFLGRVIKGSKISIENGLVDIDGIYYRYLISENRNPSLKADYVVIEIIGNIVTLRELK